MTTQAKYKTKPLDCWPKAKELVIEHYKEIATAKEDGKILISGCAASCLALPAGLGDFVYLGGEPYGAMVAHDPSFSVPAMEAAEAKGFSRDMCGYMRNYLGSMFLDKYYFTGGPWPKADFCFGRSFCDAGHASWYRAVHEYEGIPYFCYDEPQGFSWDGRIEQKKEYVAAQLFDGIEWMEKVTGRTYDDELLIDALKNFFRTEALWGEVCLLNAAIPAPLDLKTMLALMPISMLRRNEKCAVDFMLELRDEVKDRIAEGIAAVATERCRLATNAPPPWSFLKMFRHLETFGVCFVGTLVYTINSGEVKFLEDGTVVPAVPPEERGWPAMKNREDAISTLVRWLFEHPFGFAVDWDGYLVSVAKHWNVDGMALFLNRGCPLMNTGLQDSKRALQQAGLPVTIYEGNFADCRDVDETLVLDRVEAFLEGLGISRLPEL